MFLVDENTSIPLSVWRPNDSILLPVDEVTSFHWFYMGAGLMVETESGREVQNAAVCTVVHFSFQNSVHITSVPLSGSLKV